MSSVSGSKRSAQQSQPWYRQFWPWFLIALPATVVIASFFMLYLAIKYSDSLVSDNYYRDGLAINQILTQDVRAQDLKLSALIVFDGEGELVTLELAGKLEMPDILTLQLQHPTNASADTMITLMAVGGGAYRGHLPLKPRYRYYLRLMPGLVNHSDAAKLVEWRLNSELDFAVTNSVQISAATRDKQALDKDSTGSTPGDNAR
ncbi:MAG: hypothetical protein DRR06_08340 [Gammaproteobacteria bacterium]|nr:MAG: hypothetical protein DRR06_08340 [Gammaproteobacteria bacterium]RLA52718.1 MAG: hypothetical protein DRR42_06830 [Gammaproteobacteria bacterium]